MIFPDRNWVPVVRLVDPGTNRHPTKIALFSKKDVPEERHSFSDFLPPPVIEIDGTVMEFRTSEFVPKGQVYVLDTSVFAQREWLADA